MKNTHQAFSILMLTLLLILLSGPTVAREVIPTVFLKVPVPNQDSACFVPAGYKFPVMAFDGDGADALPLKYRYLFKLAENNGVEIRTRYHYDNYGGSMMEYDDPQWSGWIDLRMGMGSQPFISLPELEVDTYYLLAVQVIDADGAVSRDLEYSETVINFQISETMFQPQILVRERYLGVLNNLSTVELASGQDLNFHLQADAGHYGGTISSLRYGWDVLDIEDPNDPGWANAPGNGQNEVIVPERVFNNGMHSMVVQAVDSYGYESWHQFYLTVIPYVEPQNQLPLLLVDQVVDSNSNAWPDISGTIAYDNAQYRDQYWQFLAQGEGVVGFDWDRDRRDHTQYIAYSDLVGYKATLITARANGQQTMFTQFRPEGDQNNYVWLHPYQVRGGNLALVGERSMESFLEILPNYMTPLIFDSYRQYYYYPWETYVIGFGVAEDPDGTVYRRGTRMYPYLTAGINGLDWAVPVNMEIYASAGNPERKASCAGIKAMVLDEDFRANHQITAGTLTDTLWSNPDLDWRDTQGENQFSLEVGFPFTGNEFVDENITSRPDGAYPQWCDDGPDGLCVEPMYKGLARYDWVRENNWADGNAEWPYDQYGPESLADICGDEALTYYPLPDGGYVQLGTAKTNDLTYGYLSYKTVAEKPSGKADVYWGFDPYRFDAQESRKSIRWVLDYFGLQLNR